MKELIIKLKKLNLKVKFLTLFTNIMGHLKNEPKKSFEERIQGYDKILHMFFRNKDLASRYPSRHRRRFNVDKTSTRLRPCRIDVLQILKRCRVSTGNFDEIILKMDTRLNWVQRMLFKVIKVSGDNFGGSAGKVSSILILIQNQPIN